MNFMNVAFNEAKDKIQDLIAGWSYIRHHEVVVGVMDGENASLLYMHETGVPSRNIPPRPVMKPALAQTDVKKEMQGCYRSAILHAMFLGDVEGAEQELNKMGMAGRDACKKWISDGTNLAPNAPSTIARKGSSVPLVDTGSLLNSFTYEIREKG